MVRGGGTLNIREISLKILQTSLFHVSILILVSLIKIEQMILLIPSESSEHKNRT